MTAASAPVMTVPSQAAVLGQLATPLLSLLSLAVSALVIFLPIIRDRVDDPVDIDEYVSSERLHHSYNFIVVGGGTSGAVVASRYILHFHYEYFQGNRVEGM